MNGEEKLKNLRKIMEERKYDPYIIPHGDQHNVKINKIKNRMNTLQKEMRE